MFDYLKWLLLGCSLWNVLFCGAGITFGFAALQIPPEVFLVSVGPMFSIGTAIVGPCIDIFGPRVASISGAGLGALGYGMLTFTKANEASMLTYVGMAAITLGGIGPYISCFSVGALFASPEVPIAAITGAFTLAGLDYEVAAKLGLHRQATILTFMMLQCLAVILCVLTVPATPHLPDKPAPVLLARMCKREEPSTTDINNDASSLPVLDAPPPADTIQSRPLHLVVPSYWQNGIMRRLSQRLNDIRSESRRRLSTRSFCAQAASLEYIGMVVWYTLTLTWILYAFTFMGPTVNDEMFCKILPYVANCLPAVLSFFVGSSISYLGWGTMTAVTSFLTIGMLALTTFKSLWLSYLALMFFALSRSLVFAIFCSYIPIMFGAANYGKLMGLATLVSGATGFVNNPLSQWASFSTSNRAVCPSGQICNDWRACSRISWILAASLVPTFLYSLWLGRRKEPSTTDSTAANPQGMPLEE